MAENKKKSVSFLTTKALLYYLQEKRKKLGYQLLALAGKSKADKDIYKLLEKSRMDDHDRA